MLLHTSSLSSLNSKAYIAAFETKNLLYFGIGGVIFVETREFSKEFRTESNLEGNYGPLRVEDLISMLKKSNRSYRFWHSAGLFLSGSTALALLSFICFRLQVNSTTVGLLFLIVVVLVSLRASLLPAALVSIMAYLCLDYFFTAPFLR